MPVASPSSKSLQSDAPHHPSLRFLLWITVIKGLAFGIPFSMPLSTLQPEGRFLSSNITLLPHCSQTFNGSLQL